MCSAMVPSQAPATSGWTGRTAPGGFGCAAAVGVCSSGFCAGYASFGSGNWWFEYAGGKDENSYWDAYYYAGDQYDYYGIVEETGC